MTTKEFLAMLEAEKKQLDGLVAIYDRLSKLSEKMKAISKERTV